MPCRRVLDRGDFVPERPDSPPPAGGVPRVPVEVEAAEVPELIALTEASVARAARAIRGLAGPALIDFIRADVEELREVLFEPRSLAAIMAGMQATWWLNERLHEWLGETNAADVLTQFVPGDVTAAMGLALLDLADVIRPYPEVVAVLERGGSLDELAHC